MSIAVGLNSRYMATRKKGGDKQREERKDRKGGGGGFSPSVPGGPSHWDEKKERWETTVALVKVVGPRRRRARRQASAL